ncbi:MAG: hypothetical protein JWP25_7399 [Bradyrhizobium sp.]|jgi:hypothetical protein|nr:hypothetical protein [Bradyrhizobium sp.]
MTPHEFLNEVVEPNATDALQNPDSHRAVANAFLTMDALMGITFFYLVDRNDPRVAKHKGKDSAWKDEYAANSMYAEIFRDAAFALKHGRLTGKTPRVVSDHKQIINEPNTLGNFMLGDALEGSLMFIEFRSGAKHATRDIIDNAMIDLRKLIAGLPT